MFLGLTFQRTNFQHQSPTKRLTLKDLNNLKCFITTLKDNFLCILYEDRYYDESAYPVKIKEKN